jgi:glycerol-3-phosphate dehydrogenase
MRREFPRLERVRPFDLLVIGGGIYGAWVAYDAALRGLEVAIVERDDWGAGTSSASSKLIHGGLRYLEHYHLALVRKSLLERRRLLRLAPHQVRPLRFVIPSYRGDRVGRLRLRAGLTLYDLLAGGARDGMGHDVLDRERVLAASPFLEERGLLGGFEYGDAVMDDARLTLEVVAAAVARGAVAVNHAAADRLILRAGEAEGARITDGESGETLDVPARVTVNCAGPWAAALLSGSPARAAVRYQKGIHLVMPSLGVDHALLVMAHADGRPYFLIPWYGRTLLGTTDTLYEGDPDDVTVDAENTTYLLRDAARVLGATGWREEDVVSSFAGLRTLQARPAASPGAASREWALLSPLPRLLMPVGGKYTAARADAVRIVDGAVALLGRSDRRSRTADRVLPWTPSEPFEAWRERAVREGVAAGLDGETAAGCARRFGTGAPAIHRLAASDPVLAGRLHPDAPFCRAEVVHAARAEMARTLEDILRRRVPLALVVRPEALPLAEAAALAGAELGWGADRRDEEVRRMGRRVASR